MQFKIVVFNNAKFIISSNNFLKTSNIKFTIAHLDWLLLLTTTSLNWI